MNDELTEADVDQAVALAFGRTDNPATLALFRDAGFDDEQARRGAKLLESGAYSGFEDVATSMVMRRLDDANRDRYPGVTQGSIAAVAKRVQEQG